MRTPTLPLLLAALLPAGAAPFPVSPDGNDAANGSAATPFQTIARARDAVRTLPDAERKQPVEVILRGGLYPQDKTLVFGLADGGTKDAPVVYRAAEGETLFTENIILSGGIVHKGHNDIVNNLFINTNIRFCLYPGQQPDPGSKVRHNLFYFTRTGIAHTKDRQNSMRALTVWVSRDGMDRRDERNWIEIWRADPYHIAMGRQWRIVLDQSVEARFVRIGLRPQDTLQMQSNDERMQSIKAPVLRLKQLKVFAAPESDLPTD